MLNILNHSLLKYLIHNYPNYQLTGILAITSAGWEGGFSLLVSFYRRYGAVLVQYSKLGDLGQPWHPSLLLFILDGRRKQAGYSRAGQGRRGKREEKGGEWGRVRAPVSGWDGVAVTISLF